MLQFLNFVLFIFLLNAGEGLWRRQPPIANFDLKMVSKSCATFVLNCAAILKFCALLLSEISPKDALRVSPPLRIFAPKWCKKSTICPKTGYSAFIQLVMGFLRKKPKNSIRYPISHRKRYIQCCCPTPVSVKNVHAPRIIFRGYFGKYVFFSKKFLNEKYSKLHFLR